MRPACEVIADLAGSGLTPAQIALVMELAASVAIEARPMVDEQAERRREKDRERKRLRNSAESAESAETPAPDKSPPYPQKLTPTPGEHTHTGARGTPKFPCPKGVETEHWSDFLANRQRKRLANTATAYRAQLKALTDLSDDEWPPGRIVQFAAERGWGAIFDPRGREDRNGRHNGIDRMAGNHRGSASGRGTTIDAALAFIADGEPH